MPPVAYRPRVEFVHAAEPVTLPARRWSPWGVVQLLIPVALILGGLAACW